jgi:hypothetical protein
MIYNSDIKHCDYKYSEYKHFENYILYKQIHKTTIDGKFKSIKNKLYIFTNNKLNLGSCLFFSEVFQLQQNIPNKSQITRNLFDKH